MTQAELASALTMLREQRVSKYTDVAGGGFTVEFFPPTPPVVVEDRAAPTNDPEMCACKHHLHIAHVNGLCVEGCEPSVCHPEPK